MSQSFIVFLTHAPPYLKLRMAPVKNLTDVEADNSKVDPHSILKPLFQEEGLTVRYHLSQGTQRKDILTGTLAV